MQSADLGRNEDNAIYRLGCLSVLDDLYLTEVKPILKPFYMILSIAIAIVEIVSVAVAAAYISNIKKRVPSVKFWFEKDYEDIVDINNLKERFDFKKTITAYYTQVL